MTTTNNKQLVIQGIIGLIAILGITVGPNVLTDDLSNQYVCLIEDEPVQIKGEMIHTFDGGTSKSLYTGYPLEGTRAGYIRCVQNDVAGEWHTLSEYAEMVNITIEDLEIPNETPEPLKQNNTGVNQYYCLPADGGCCEIC